MNNINHKNKPNPEQYWIVVKNLMRLRPNTFSRENIEKLCQRNILDYSYAEEALNIADAYAAMAQENVSPENMMGDDNLSNGYDQQFMQNLGIQRVKIDSALEMAKAKKDNRLNTIYDLVNDLDTLTKQIMQDYGKYEDIVMDDIRSILDDSEDINFINKVTNTEVRTILNDDGGDKSYHNDGEAKNE